MPTRLTDRELECLRLVADSLFTRQIADRLGISSRTVDHHIARACRKLGVFDRKSAVQMIGADYLRQTVPIPVSPIPRSDDDGINGEEHGHTDAAPAAMDLEPVGGDARVLRPGAGPEIRSVSPDGRAEGGRGQSDAGGTAEGNPVPRLPALGVSEIGPRRSVPYRLGLIILIALVIASSGIGLIAGLAWAMREGQTWLPALSH